MFTACGIKHRRCCQQAESSVLYTTSCKHSLVVLMMGEIIARNMLGWLKLLIKLLLLHLVGCLYYYKKNIYTETSERFASRETGRMLTIQVCRYACLSCSFAVIVTENFTLICLCIDGNAQNIDLKQAAFSTTLETCHLFQLKKWHCREVLLNHYKPLDTNVTSELLLHVLINIHLDILRAPLVINFACVCRCVMYSAFIWNA